jgi:hypothetical protein
MKHINGPARQIKCSVCERDLELSVYCPPDLPGVCFDCCCEVQSMMTTFNPEHKLYCAVQYDPDGLFASVVEILRQKGN